MTTPTSPTSSGRRTYSDWYKDWLDAEAGPFVVDFDSDTINVTMTDSGSEFDASEVTWTSVTGDGIGFTTTTSGTGTYPAIQPIDHYGNPADHEYAKWLAENPQGSHFVYKNCKIVWDFDCCDGWFVGCWSFSEERYVAQVRLRTGFDEVVRMFEEFCKVADNW